MKIVLAVIMAIVVPGGLIILALAFFSKRLVSTGRLSGEKLQKLLDTISRPWKPGRMKVATA